MLVSTVTSTIVTARSPTQLSWELIVLDSVAIMASRITLNVLEMASNRVVVGATPQETLSDMFPMGTLSFQESGMELWRPRWNPGELYEA